MNPSRHWCSIVLLTAGSLAFGCSESFEDQPQPGGSVGGTGGTSATGGSGGTGVPTDSGLDGSSGGGAAGSSGQGGTAASGGAAGSAGEGGTAGASGDAGASGQGGSAGVSGEGGAAGASGTGGTGPDPCPPGYDDCDDDDANGCETPLDTVENCGSCATTCSAAANADPHCENGTCTLACTGTFRDCDGNANNGCEVDITNDASHCGACNDACPSGGHGTPTCQSSTCGITCTTGWSNCDTSLANGCEIDLTTDASNCGTCNNVCPNRANATPTCNGSQCGFTCLTGFANCNNTASDGCEVDLNQSTAHCGACSKPCGTANGTADCSGGVCSIQCNPGWGDCDGVNSNGCETNLATTAKHCGTCGHDCLGGTCAASMCTAWTLATTTNYASRIAVNETHVYFTDKTGVYRVPLGGGVPQFLVASTQATALDLDTANVYWVTLKATLNNGVYRAPLAGGVAYALQEGLDTPHDVALDNGFAYWCHEGGIRRRAKGSTGVTNVLTGIEVDSIALDADNVYFAVDDALGKVAWVPKAGGSVTDLNTNQNRPTDIAVDDEWVYFPVFASGIVKKVRKSGTGTTVLASGYANPSRLDIDDTHVFFTDSNGGLVVQIPKNYGTAVVRHSATSFPQDIKVSGGVVYWAGVGDKTIMAMVK